MFYAYTALLLVAFVFLNYRYQLGERWTDDHNHWTDLLKLFSFYAFAYYAVALPKGVLFEAEYLHKKEFWVKSFFFLLLLSADGSFYGHGQLAYACTSWSADEQYFVYKLLTNIYPSLIYFPLLGILYLLYDKGSHSFYGFTSKGVDYPLYVFFLLFMIPLITWASFQPDFLITYPEFKPWRTGAAFGLSKWEMSAAFEVFYLLDFTTVELIFRGAMIISLSAVMGRHAVLPMVVAYAFLHFGKPMGETLGSMFGGYILGIIALYSRSILGGCLIHIGVAFLMELAALLQHEWFRS